MNQEGANNSKRRRGLGVVTPNACTECRKKRAKCDGQTPCGRCTSQGVDCVYEVPVRQSKENMRSEIESLRNSRRQHERILQALIASDTSEQILESLRRGETAEKIVEKLEGNLSPAVVSGTNVTTFAKLSDQQAIGGALSRARSIGGSPSSAFAFSDSTGTGIHHYSNEGSVWQPQWGIGHPNMAYQDSQSGIHQEDMMKWEPDMVDLSYPLVGTWHQQSHPDSTPDSTTQMARGEGQETILGQTFGMEEDAGSHQSYAPNHNQSWTFVTSNGAFVEHLMALYFCWEYPTFASLSKEHFLHDFRTGNPRYCSSLLVNALLALGCKFSSQAEARTNPDDPNTAGNHFFAEAVHLLEAENDRHVLTTIQALGLMSIREASCGRSSESLFYSGQSIRLAMEMGLHMDVKVGEGKEAESDHAVRSATFWGAFSLDQAWNLSIGRLPHFSRDIILITKPSIIEEIEASEWIPYTDDGRNSDSLTLICSMTNHSHAPGAPMEKSCTQPSNVRSVYRTFCELSEIVHKSIYALYAPGSDVTSQKLLQSYTAYLRWYETIPTTLRLGHNFTPAVLFAHMYYHFAILLLFRPFIKLYIPSSSVSPMAITLQAAEAISALVNSYSKLYTLRRTPSFVPYFVLTSSIIHLVTLGTNRGGLDAVKQGISDLQEMKACHGFASRALEILKYLVKHWEIKADLFSPELKAEIDEGAVEDDACKPSSTSLNQFCPNVGPGHITSDIAKARDGENPLFWAFPLQGRPLLDIGDAELAIAGFRVLK